MNMLSIQCITFDSENPSIPGKFWSEALGWQISISNDEEVVVENLHVAVGFASVGAHGRVNFSQVVALSQ